MLEKKKRIWGDIVLSDGAKWKEAGYPVAKSSISGARKWLLDLAEELILSAEDECHPWFEGNMSGSLLPSSSPSPSSSLSSLQPQGGFQPTPTAPTSGALHQGVVTNERQAKKVRELMEIARMTLRLVSDIVDTCGSTSLAVIQVRFVLLFHFPFRGKGHQTPVSLFFFLLLLPRSEIP